MPSVAPLPASVTLREAPGSGGRGGAARPALNRNLFGKFTEHLGRNVYGGAWAQVVRNPEFAGPLAWPHRDELLRRLQAAVSEFHLTGLPGALADGLAPWWVPLGPLHVAREERRGRTVLRIATQGQPGGRLVTPLYLPTHRTVGYRLQLVLRSDVPVDVSLHVAASASWASARLEPSTRWTVQTVDLVGRDGSAPPPGTSFTLAIAPSGSGSVELRRCLLFPADHLDGWDPDVVRFLRDAHMPLLRFPGGNFVSGYHWRDGVGPLEDRPVLPNPAWPEVEWNHVGTDEWLHLCELIGCTPLICLNAGNGTAQEAADWVEYCNGDAGTPMGAQRALNGHPEPYGVLLWEIGNELYGAWQVGGTDAAEYAARYRRFADAMLARDPGIRLIANGDTEDWNRTVVAAGGDHVRSFSHHCLYGQFTEDMDPLRVYLEHMAFTPAYARRWEHLAGPLTEAGRPPRLAITEEQIFTKKPSLPNNSTLAEAVFDASILNEAIRAGDIIELVTHSALINHGAGLRKEREVVYAQPSWWTTHLYASAPDPLYPVPLDIDSPRFSVDPYRLRTVPDAPYLDAVAALDQDAHTLVFFLVNRHPDAALRVAFTLPGWQGTRAETHTLTGPSFMAGNTWREPDMVPVVRAERAWERSTGELLLAPCSVVRLQLT